MQTYILFFFNTLLLAAISYFMPVMDPNFVVPEHIVVAMFFSINIFLLAQHPLRLLNNHFTRFLGNISFSLYLVHFIVIYLLADYCPLPSGPFARYFTLLFLTLTISSCIAKLTHGFVELKGVKIGNKFIRTKVHDIESNPAL